MSAVSAVALSVESVSRTFKIQGKALKVVDNVSFDVFDGECLAVVGESGSGKTTIANIILSVITPDSGTISLAGEPLPARRELAHRRAVQLVQQNPLSSLNPSLSIGRSIRLALDVHGIGEPQSRPQRVASLLEEVGLEPQFARRRPSALSGGQRQRVSIARALACQPQVLVLDEPTSALDVLVQSRVLDLLRTLRQRHHLTYIFITHDLAVVRSIADRVAVIEHGRLVELGQTDRIFTSPEHRYTRKLLAAVPVLDDEEIKLRNRLLELSANG